MSSNLYLALYIATDHYHALLWLQIMSLAKDGTNIMIYFYWSRKVYDFSVCLQCLRLASRQARGSLDHKVQLHTLYSVLVNLLLSCILQVETINKWTVTI